MAATTHTVAVRPASAYSPERHIGGSAPVDGSAAGAAAFEAVADVRGALAVCSAAVKTDRAVTANSIGRATSVLT